MFWTCKYVFLRELYDESEVLIVFKKCTCSFQEKRTIQAILRILVDYVDVTI